MNILYIGNANNLSLNKYKYLFNNTNYFINIMSNLNEINNYDNKLLKVFNNNDFIILDTYINNIDILNILSKYNIIYNNNKYLPINIDDIHNDEEYKIIHKLYLNNIFNLTFGLTDILYPSYIDKIDLNKNKIINDYVSNITLEKFNNKLFCCMIEDHDYGNTKSKFYNKLSSINNIASLGKLFNNFQINNNNIDILQQQFIFTLCPEDYYNNSNTSLNISEKLLNACYNGTIPIYYGTISENEKKIFNINRIIFFDPLSDESIENTILFIKELLSNLDKLYEYYKQPIFLDSVNYVINNYLLNLDNISNYIKNKYIERKINIIPYSYVNYSDNNINSNIIISLTTNIENISSENFGLLIHKLYSQTIKPKYIFVKVNLSETTTKPYKIIKDELPNLIINCFNSNSLFGSLENIIIEKDLINDNDKIIFINDTKNIDINFILMYELCYQLYNCDGIIESNYNDCLFWDNYNEDIKYSFSFKYKYIKKILISEEISNLEDLFYRYYKNNKLYVCGLNILYNNECKNTCNKNLYDKIYINNELESRYLLYNTDLDYTCTYDKHLDIKYLDNNKVIATITYFQDIPLDDSIKINNIIINFKNTYITSKKSFLLLLNFKYNRINNNNNNSKIFQILNDNTYYITYNNFYSIMTICNLLPELEYKLFNNEEIINTINNNNIIYQLYNKVNNILIKYDLFKTWYIYNNGGIYFDLSTILYSNINYIFDNNYSLLNSFNNNGILLNFMYVKNINDNLIYDYLIDICYNILSSSYNSDYLSISNCNLLLKFIKNQKVFLLNTELENDNLLIKDDDNLLIKIYYKNNNEIINDSFNSWYYGTLYKNISYSNIISNKFNGVDHILWINLERSYDRRIHMEKILSNINVSSTRIEAIDGKYTDLQSLPLLNPQFKITNYLLAGGLSHVKAINYLKNIEGNYFCILEDDVLLDNTILFNYDLKEIINNAPDFNVLSLHQCSTYDIDKLYISHSDFKNKYIGCEYYSAACYILSRNGINELLKLYEYDFNTKKFNINHPFGAADIFLYQVIDKVYYYKYNFVNTLDNNTLMENTYVHNIMDNFKYATKKHQINIIKDLL